MANPRLDIACAESAGLPLDGVFFAKSTRRFAISKRHPRRLALLQETVLGQPGDGDGDLLTDLGFGNSVKKSRLLHGDTHAVGDVRRGHVRNLDNAAASRIADACMVTVHDPIPAIVPHRMAVPAFMRF